MRSRLVVVVIVAATLVAAAFPALSKESGGEGTPAYRSQQRLPQASVDERTEPRHHAPRYVQAQPEAHRRDHPAPNADHRHGEHRHADRRHWHNPIPDQRHFGHVLPRPRYDGVPRVYYAPPVAYYGAAARTYYPYAAPALVLQPGDYLPYEYRSQQFVVVDWEWRGLSAPPYGYQWMLLGPDNFALVAVSTGQIVSLVAVR